MALLVAACSGDDTTATTAAPSTTFASTTTTSVTTTTTPPVESTTTTVADGVGVSEDFRRTIIEIGEMQYRVAVAETPQETAQGLMFVTQLAPLDGMLFVYGAERQVQHWMKDTLIPLDIAFFDADGRFVSKASMIPCTEENDADCPRYPAAGPAAYSVEVAAGVFSGLSEDARLVILDTIVASVKEN